MQNTRKKIRLLVAGDIHGSASIMKRLAERAAKEKVDAVVLTGDLTDFDMYGKGLIYPFIEKKIEVLFVPGNHDITAGEVLPKKYNIKNLQFYPVTIGNVGFFGCGTASVGPNFLTEDDIAGYLNRGFEKVKESDRLVMVTHMRPAGSKIEKIYSRFRYSGSDAIREAIVKFKPDLNICGHIHEAEDIVEEIGKTLVMGTGPGGKIVEL